MADEAKRSTALSDLPIDELIFYGSELGLRLDSRMGHGELLRRVRERQELLVELEREALLDVVIWARRPVRKSASKEHLAKEIASIVKMDFTGLSDRGLIALARLRGVTVCGTEPRAVIEEHIRLNEPFWHRVRRKRRMIMGSLISRVVSGPAREEDGDYRFLPENGGAPSLKEEIAEEGVVGGIARKLRVAADDYVRQKLDEIEARIDRKLDEIDRRLSEWRDREVANRLKIIKITLAASVIVAIISLVYSYIKPLVMGLVTRG